MREEPACKEFSGGVGPPVNGGVALPRVRGRFLLSCFQRLARRVLGPESCAGRRRSRCEGAEFAGLLRSAPGTLPLPPWELGARSIPGRVGGRWRPLPSASWRRFPASHWACSRKTQLPTCPSGLRARGHLDVSPCWSALSRPCTRRLRTSPPTCSLLLTSRAAGTMGWGCHSNQTGRHNPGMCAAPPSCSRAAGAAIATLGRLQTQAAGREGRSGPGFSGAERRRPNRRGRDGGV